MQQLVPGLDGLCQHIGKTRDAKVKSQAIRDWLLDCKAAVVKSWEALGFPEHPEYLDPSGSVSAVGTSAGATGGKMIVFDFDQTLTTVHVEKERLHTTTLVDQIFGGHARVALLDELFGELYARGILLGICSMNSTSTIMRTLEMREAAGGVNLLKYFDPGLIFGQEVTDDIDAGDKGVTVRDRMMPARERVKLLFVDDTQKHCTAVSSACERVETLTVAGHRGLDDSELIQIRKWAAT